MNWRKSQVVEKSLLQRRCPVGWSGRVWHKNYDGSVYCGRLFRFFGWLIEVGKCSGGKP